MYKINFYKDKAGREPVAEYLSELSSKHDKNSRVKLNKIRDYIKLLEQFGLSLGEPYIKHIEDDLWELRPIRDRIFFMVWHDNSFILLHHFMKKSQKTPRKEIEAAKRKINDLKSRG